MMTNMAFGAKWPNTKENGEVANRTTAFQRMTYRSQYHHASKFSERSDDRKQHTERTSLAVPPG